jgi:outer membrane biosynthesis protein TonB
MDNRLQILLEKYREGVLSDSERSELERLSHKDEVFSAAHSRATGIIRRRVALAVSALMICGAGIWAVLPGSQQMPEVAEVVQPVPEPPVEVQETVAPKAVAEPTPLVAEAREVKRHADTARKARPAQVAPTEKPAEVVVPERSSSEPVVMCNNQCDADSVISDIRKFLAYEGL